MDKELVVVDDAVHEVLAFVVVVSEIVSVVFVFSVEHNRVTFRLHKGLVRSLVSDKRADPFSVEINEDSFFLQQQRILRVRKGDASRHQDQKKAAQVVLFLVI